MSSSPKRFFGKWPFIAALLIAVPLGFFRLIPWAMPYQSQSALDSLQFSKVVVDKTGSELQVLPVANGLRRIFTPLQQVPPELVDIVRQAEDRRFWLHPGVDPISLVRAVWQNSTAHSTVSGASTITMQLARLITPRGRTTSNKIVEAYQALQLESRIGKAAVLELYLSLVPFGGNIEGFQAAARAFFGKPLSQLTKAELLILAVIPRSPNNNNPFIHPESNRAAVQRLGIALPDTASLDSAYQAVLDPSRLGIWPFQAPHFVRWLANQPAVAANPGRLPIQTGIEPDLQSYLENLLLDTVDAARKKRISNAAGIFVRPDTMTIAAWVGSIDFSSVSDQGQVDGVIMHRQPGSTLKPFLYSLALEKGFTAATILPDIPTDFGGAEVYTPANFNDQFNGPVRLRQALASSLNVPAVYTLQRVGVGPFTDRLLQAGFQSLESQRGSLGLGLALGNAEISLYELVQAYGLFLHSGSFMPLRAIEGKDTPVQAGRPVVKPQVADLIRDILTRHPDRILAFGHNGNTHLQFEGAMKTGTSNQFNNIWAVGFTSDLLGGVWMGNMAGQTVVGTADSGYPAGIMSKMLETFSAHVPFSPLTGLERVSICSLSGERATDACPHTIQEWFLPGTAPPACDWHYVGPQGVEIRYPQEYQTWLSRYRYRFENAYQASEVEIIKPNDGAVFFMDPTLPLRTQQLSIEATGTGRAGIFIDGIQVYRGVFPVRTWYQLAPGHHTIVVEGAASSASADYVVR